MNSLKPLRTLTAAAALLVLTAGWAAAQIEEEPEPEETTAQEQTAPGLIEEETVAYTRQGWFFGMSFGTGGAEGRFGVPNHPEIDQERELGFGIDLRLGWAPTEQLLLGVNGVAWLKNYDILDGDTGRKIPTDVSYSIFGGFVQYFVYEGFFVRGMAGLGYTHAKPRQESALDESGLGYSFGVGWEARLTSTLALTPYLQYGRLMIDNTDVADGDGGLAPVDPSAIFINLTLGLTWYF